MTIDAGKLNPYTGKWGRAQLLCLLRRTVIGVTQNDVKFFEGKSLKECLDILLTITIPAPPINNINHNAFTDPDVPLGKTWINAPSKLDGTAEYLREENYRAWWFGCIWNHNLNITERLTLFWHNHFVTEAKMVGDARYSYKLNNLLRTNALGNFKRLTKEVSTQPAMLVYLNGNTNVKGQPNENYGRELQELFTIGKGPDSHYTEQDVKAAARVLTGWKDDAQNITGTFYFDDHDTGDKEFSSFYNNAVIKGRKGTEGANELTELVNIIFANKETARFLCRKLYRWFLYSNIDEKIENEIIIPLADMLIANNFEVKPVLRALLGSEHFYEAYLVGGMIKSPIEFDIGLLKQFKIPMPSEENYQRYLYKVWLEIERFTGLRLTQYIADPPNVAGWPAYYQVPSYYNVWINADTLLLRNKITDMLSSKDGSLIDREQISGKRFVTKIHFASFISDFSDPADSSKLLAESIALLCPIPIAEAGVSFLKTLLESNRPGDENWTTIWDKYKKNMGDENLAEVVEARLRKVYAAVMRTAQFQMM